MLRLADIRRDSQAGIDTRDKPEVDDAERGRPGGCGCDGSTLRADDGVEAYVAKVIAFLGHIDGYAAAAAGAVCDFGNGLKVMAIRKAPRPMPHEPT